MEITLLFVELKKDTYNKIYLKAKKTKGIHMRLFVARFHYFGLLILIFYLLQSQDVQFFINQGLKKSTLLYQLKIRLGSKIINCSQIVLKIFIHNQNLDMYLDFFLFEVSSFVSFRK